MESFREVFKDAYGELADGSPVPIRIGHTAA